MVAISEEEAYYITLVLVVAVVVAVGVVARVVQAGVETAVVVVAGVETATAVLAKVVAVMVVVAGVVVAIKDASKWLVSLSIVIGVQREMNRTVEWLSYLWNMGVQAEIIIYLEEYFVPIYSFPVSVWFLISLVWSSCISSQLSLLLLCLFPHMYSVVGHISFILPVQGGIFSAHSWDSGHLSCLDISAGLVENGENS